MPIWQLCANLLIPNCLRSNLSYSPLAALELYVKPDKKKISIIYRKKRLVSPAQISNFVRLSLAPHASHHFQSVYVKA